MLSAVIVGAGFSGIAAGIQLKRAGFDDFVILEKDDRVGGTWRQNTYPGAACDIPSHLYSYSFEPNSSWSRTYGGQVEILAYLQHCADKYGLTPHFRFGQHVDEARFDEANGVWTIATRDGLRIEARALILGNGFLHQPQQPDVPGLETFAGARFHTSRWNHDFDLAGKRIAVIGTGASAIQVVPQLAPRVAQLHVFQRTPPWIIPKSDRLMSERERWVFEKLPAAHWLRRTGLYWWMESRVIGFVHAPKLLALAEKLVLRGLAQQVPDPVLRAKLTPDYRFGCKRVLLSNEYYPALQRPNVELVTDRIDEVTPRGIRTGDREYEVDAIISATGFRVTEYLSAIKIVGRGGAVLEEAWQTSMRNYLGITVSRFPNLFLLMGPNTGLGHNSMIFMIEAQARYAAHALTAMRERKLAFIDVRPEVEAAFRAELSHKMQGTVWMTGCRSWYQTPSGEVFLWPGATFDYWRRTRRIDLADFEQRAA